MGPRFHPPPLKVDVDAAGEGLVFGGVVPEEVTEPVAVFEVGQNEFSQVKFMCLKNGRLTGS